MFKLVFYIVAFVAWSQRTSLRRSCSIFGYIFLGGLATSLLMTSMGIHVEITSTFLPETLASVSFYVIYYMWAIALWKIVVFFSKKKRVNHEPVLPIDIRKVKMVRGDVSLN